MKLFTLACITAVTLLLPYVCPAQDAAVGYGCAAKSYGRAAAKTTVASPAEDNYDVKYLKFDINMSNRNTFVSGSVFTAAQVVGLSLPTYVFELDAALTVDSAFVNGIPHPITTKGSVRTITLPTALYKHSMFTAQVYYHGASVPTSSFFNGINNRSSSWGDRITFTLSQPYNASAWWPCKQSLRDKIDSVDMWITVDDTLKAGSNGLLRAITPMPGQKARYDWKSRYPIDFYLISAAVAPYQEYAYYIRFKGSTDSMLFQNFIYRNPGYLATTKRDIDSTALMINYFSEIFGRYPFWEEKYGHCVVPMSGGMEHQTMTSQGFFTGTLTAHELAHQWFGDNVTCAAWADIFVNEGFASYSEYLFIDRFRNRAKAINHIKAKQSDVRSLDAGTVYVDDTTTEDRIFDSRLSYNKGACVLHMLRSVVNDDTAFFQLCKTYQQKMGGSNASISDFIAVAKKQFGTNVNGINLDTFFHQWIYAEGYPIHSLTWNQAGSDVYLKLDQATILPASVSLFTLPLEIRLQSATGDTTIRVINDQASQYIRVSWSKQITSVVLDPNSWLLDSVQANFRDTKLGVSQHTTHLVTIWPNPATTNWRVMNVPDHSFLSLTDINGRVLWTRTNEGSTTTEIPGNALAAGMYMLRVVSDEGSETYRLMKE